MLITWEIQGYYWLQYFFCYSLSLIFLTHHPNTLWIHEIHVLKNKGMISFHQHSIIDHQWSATIRKTASMTKGVVTGICRSGDCLYAAAHKENKLIFSLSYNWTFNNYSLCFGSMEGCDLWVFCWTQYVFENTYYVILFSVEVVTKHKAKTLASIPKYNF